MELGGKRTGPWLAVTRRAPSRQGAKESPLAGAHSSWSRTTVQRHSLSEQTGGAGQARSVTRGEGSGRRVLLEGLVPRMVDVRWCIVIMCFE
jgi:hypothetical protein